MEKKPEEIMAIVLDYCHHACPEIGKNVPLYEGAYLKKDIDGYGIYHYWGSDRGNATCICTVPTRSTFIANPNVFTAFYKLLGLDKRDALEAEKEKSKRWESRAWKILQIIRQPSHRSRPKTAAVLRTLREVSEKNERLVEELEEIKYEDEVNGKGWENNHNSTYSRLCRVLEAYKEGKKDEN